MTGSLPQLRVLVLSRRTEAPPEPDTFPLPGAAPKIGSEAADGPQRERGTG